MKLILDPARCKPIFVALHPPHSSLPTQRKHVLHLRALHIMHSRERTSGLSIAAARSFLLSAAIGISVFLVRAYNHASIASGLCFARMSRVSLSLVHHHLHDIVMTSCDYFRRQRTSQPAIWRERLPLGTAEGAPGAVRLKIYACAHRYCCCCTSGHVGVARPRHGTNAGCLHFVWGWEARKQAD